MRRLAPVWRSAQRPRKDFRARPSHLVERGAARRPDGGVGDGRGPRESVRPALSVNDEDILSDSDAFARPRVAALVPLEDLTPHARDLGADHLR